MCYIRRAGLLVFFAAVAACSSTPTEVSDASPISRSATPASDAFGSIENRLGTKPQFHVCAAPDSGDKCSIRTSHSVYIVGVEKADRDIVGRYQYKDCGQDTLRCFNSQGPYYKNRAELVSNIDSRLDDKKSHFISHVVRFDPTTAAPASGVSPKQLIFNVYGEERLPDAKEGTPTLVDKSWDVLSDTFASDLLRRIDEVKATHVMVYATGWKTPQEESIGDFQNWFDALQRAHEEHMTKRGAGVDPGSGATQSDFRPIYIGITWPSLWKGLPEDVSYCNKAHDADEIGYTWANVLINRVLGSAAKQTGVKVIVVSHSFGARLLSRAVHSASLFSNDSGTLQDAPVDLFIGLQGAFTYKRFLADVKVKKPDLKYKVAGCVAMGNEGGPYNDFPLRAKKLLFTSSAHDGAVDGTPEDVFIGNDFAFTETQKGPASRVFEHTSLQADGHWTKAPTLDQRTITIIDASDVVRRRVEKRGGSCTSAKPCGPHNDVFNLEIGRFTWDAIALYAPSSR